jgi:hypothetical protein
MPAPLFKDLYKPFKDLHTKTFDVVHKIEVKPKDTPDVEIDLLAPSVQIKTKTPCVEGVTTKLKGSGPFNGEGGRVEFTNEFKSGAITVSDTATYTTGTGADWSATTQYEADSFSAAATFESKKSATHLAAGNWSATFNAVKQFGQFLLGAQASLPLCGAMTPELKLGGRFKTGDYIVGFEGDLQNVTLALNCLCNAITYGLELKAKAFVPTSAAAVIGWDVGKCRIEFPTGKTQTALWTPIYPGVKLNLAAETNIFGAKTCKWGVGVTIERAL